MQMNTDEIEVCRVTAGVDKRRLGERDGERANADRKVHGRTYVKIHVKYKYKHTLAILLKDILYMLLRLKTVPI